MKAYAQPIKKLIAELGKLPGIGEKTAARLANYILRSTEDDVKKLAELVQIVKQAGDRNEKVNNIVNNAEKFGGIILTLLSKFA